MNITQLPTQEHEKIYLCTDESVGLEAIIAIHTLYSKMSLGGCRVKAFSSREMAINEAMRLSTHMTYKSLLAGLDMGGGKSVIIAKKKFQKTPEFWRSFAKIVHSLKGQYIVSVDAGTNVKDMQQIRKTTHYVTGYDEQQGGAGDPGPFTARGVLQAMKSASLEKWGITSLKNRKVWVAGLGGVGYPLSFFLLQEGVRLIVSDTDDEKIQNIKNHHAGVEVVDPYSSYNTLCDIFAPCAFGDVFTMDNVQSLQCNVIAGAANNQLQSEKVGDILHQKNILYLPDFAINSGGLIGVVTHGVRKKSKNEAIQKIDHIFELTRHIIQKSYQLNQSTHKVALQMAQKKYKTMYSLSKT